jgi:hypothetical protein
MIPSYLLPEGTPYFVAGGWAACPALATDMDVWVTSDNPARTRTEILEHFNAKLFADEYEEERSDEVAGDVDAYSNPLTLKVARVLIGQKRFHILVTSGDISDVLNGFDISTHQVAITDSGTVVRGYHWTPVTEPPIKLKDTPTTNDRLIKIAARYGHPFDLATLITLREQSTGAEVI